MRSGGYSWGGDIRARVALAKTTARDEAEFLGVLDALGVHVADNSAKARRDDWVFSLAALGGPVISLLEVISSYTGLEIAFLSHLPLASLGVAGVVPALLCGVIGHFIPHGKKKSLAS